MRVLQHHNKDVCAVQHGLMMLLAGNTLQKDDAKEKKQQNRHISTAMMSSEGKLQ